MWIKLFRKKSQEIWKKSRMKHWCGLGFCSLGSVDPPPPLPCLDRQRSIWGELNPQMLSPPTSCRNVKSPLNTFNPHKFQSIHSGSSGKYSVKSFSMNMPKPEAIICYLRKLWQPWYLWYHSSQWSSSSSSPDISSLKYLHWKLPLSCSIATWP